MKNRSSLFFVLFLSFFLPHLTIFCGFHFVFLSSIIWFFVLFPSFFLLPPPSSTILTFICIRHHSVFCLLSSSGLSFDDEIMNDPFYIFYFDSKRARSVFWNILKVFFDKVFLILRKCFTIFYPVFEVCNKNKSRSHNLKVIILWKKKIFKFQLDVMSYAICACIPTLWSIF